MNTDASAKIKMLKSSLQCCVCGLLGLLPVIGLPFAIAALVISGRVRAGQKKYWNAAGLTGLRASSVPPSGPFFGGSS